jgi:hypothetical protein
LTLNPKTYPKNIEPFFSMFEWGSMLSYPYWRMILSRDLFY